MNENHGSLVADEVITQLKERIAELEEQRAIDMNAAYDSFTGDLQALQDANRRKAELERENERLKQYACQCEASVHSTQERIAELEDLEKNFAACDKQRLEFHERSAELEAKNDELKAIGHRKNEECFKKAIRIAELEAEVEHYKEWLKERTSELQAQLDAQVESARLINVGADQRIAELEAQLEKSKEVQLELGQAIKKKDQRSAELEDFINEALYQLDFHSIQAAELLEKGKK